MNRCLVLAKKATGMTSPNPMVGALLYKDGRIIAEDYHRKAGSPHAEALVLEKAGAQAKDAVLFVNLEPCCHKEKRTPPCTDAIIRHAVRHVFVAMEDPNPYVNGKGVESLRQAGIYVEIGPGQEKARHLNEVYVKYITTKTPFAILKMAMTLDGKIATPKGQSKWISSEASRRLVHRMRGSVDAVLTAIGTVKADNPRFTARIKGLRDPLRIIIDPLLETPEDYHVLDTPGNTLIVTRTQDSKTLRLLDRGVRFIFYDGTLDMKWLMSELGSMGITSIMIEGGTSLAAHAMEEAVVDKVMFFIAPKIIGGKDSFTAIGGRTFRPIEQAYKIDEFKAKKIGTDILITGYVR